MYLDFLYYDTRNYIILYSLFRCFQKNYLWDSWVGIIISYWLSWRLSYCFRAFGFSPDIIRAPPQQFHYRAGLRSSVAKGLTMSIVFSRPHSTYSFVLFRPYVLGGQKNKTGKKALFCFFPFFYEFAGLGYRSTIGSPPMISHSR